MSNLNNQHNGNNMRIVVVGNGMVGHHFVDQLIQQNTLSANVDSDDDAENTENGITLDVVVLSAEPRLAYDHIYFQRDRK